MKLKKAMALLLCSTFLICVACGKQQQKNETQATKNETQITTSVKNQTSWWGNEETYSSIAIETKLSDPYSFVIKERYKDLASTTKDGYAYVSKLFLYGLYDIDGNGIDELLLTNYYPQWGGFEYGQDTENVPVFEWLYTIHNQKVEEIQLASTWRWFYFAEAMGGRDVLTNGVIRLYGGSPDHISYAYYRYVDGELTFLKALKNYASTGYWLETDDDGPNGRIPIPEAEFNRLRAEIEGDAQVVEIDWKPLESYGRE